MSTVPPYATRSRAAAAAAAKNTTTGKPGATHPPAGPKRALGDITNAHAHQQQHGPLPSQKQHHAHAHAHAHNHNTHHSESGTTTQSGKIRRTVPTKPSSAATARRALAARAQRARKAQQALEQQQRLQQCAPDADTPLSVTAAQEAGVVAAAVAAASLATPAGVSKDETLLSASVDGLESLIASPPCRRRSVLLLRLPSNVCDIDAGDARDPLAVSQFAPYIYDNFRRAETRFMVAANYMDAQEDITVKMRAILVDWLVDVHQKFKLTPETLHLTVNIIDRFLAVTPVKRRKLQLVGVTAMLIASKYEEIYAPETADFVYISDKAYDRDEILHMEAVILNVLKFDVTVPSSLAFLQRCFKAARAMPPSGVSTSKSGGRSSSVGSRSGSSPAETASASAQNDVGAGGLSPDAEHFAMYLLELSLQSATMLPFRSSVRAATACRLAGKLFRECAWSATLQHHSGDLKPEDLTDCEREMLELVETEVSGAATNKLTAIKRKFGSPKYNEISLLAMEMDYSTVGFCEDSDARPAASTGASDYASMDICEEDHV